MDQYGRMRNGSDQQHEWSSAGEGEGGGGGGGGGTGLEESMWQMGLTANGASYPELPGVPNCVYYMRTGFCGYGSRCRYNHPPDRAAVVAAVRVTGEYPLRPGEPECQYYLKTWTCKYGASCKFHHPKHGVGSVNQAPLNLRGYPLRPGERECSYYLKSGQCKYGIACKFHHPQMNSIPMQPPSTPQFYHPQFHHSPLLSLPEQYGSTSTSLRVVTRPPVLPNSYMQGPYGPVLLSPGVVPISGWTSYSAPVTPSVLSPGAAHMSSSSTTSFLRPYTPITSPVVGTSGSSIQSAKVFPARPCEPECQYYLKTGNCKFGSSCRFHHPQDLVPPSAGCVLSPLGLPCRPGMQPCTFYLQNGHCKFGSTCKFDHPMGYNNSQKMAISRYQVGSLLGTLSPSTVSSLKNSAHATLWVQE